MKRLGWWTAILILWALPSSGALAQSAPACSFQPDGSILCITGGVGDDHGTGNPVDDPFNTGGACTEGQHAGYQIVSYDAAAGTCQAFQAQIDNCTGQFVEALSDDLEELPCSTPANSQPQSPCDHFTVSAGGITCTNNGWQIRAHVTFPEIDLDVRPYPATLVRWPTTLRNGGMSTSTGSGRVNYISKGGGSPGQPQVGDWQALRLSLTLRPAGPLFVTLTQVGDLLLANGASRSIQWEVPSHPTVGAGPLAGTITGLDELPADMPVFVGHGQAPYHLFWELRYQEYAALQECVAGPNGNGQYNCGKGTGHKVISGYAWQPHSSGGEIPPSAVTDLPAALQADLNQDGTPDAYWDKNLTLRRMDASGSVSNPNYQHAWNWGGNIYWAVREGQGQIGWPGQ